MSYNKNHNKRRGEQPKLEEFPEDFDDTFFHNEVVDSIPKIENLRHIVYKKVKTEVENRIKSYGTNPPLSDSFDVLFLTSEHSFSNFEWAVVREEIMSCGIDVTSEFKDEKLFSLCVHVKREISLTTTMDELNLRNDSDSDHSDHDDD